MNKIILSLTSILFLLSTVNLSISATYYIRPNGGTAQQCNGTVDVDYPGSGVGQPCAWSHPFWALDAEGSWKIGGGDTLLISSGSYRMGFGAPNTGWCSSDSAWACHLPPLPSGPNSINPTRILGVGWNSGCSNPPDFWGTQRADYILNLEGTSNAIVNCLELTDHSVCVEYHSNTSVACNRDTYPYGDWASAGIYASDASNIILRHLNIHGFASAGIIAARLTDWLVEDVKIAGHGWVGWEGDLPGDNNDSNSGTLTFKRLVVEWNGCAESYPGKEPNNCWAQTAGGYGDGFGTGRTGGRWIFEDSIFRYNTSDGLDLLYVREGNSQIEIRRTKSYGNAGDQIKTNGPVKIENSLMVSNCGYFEGKPFTYHVDPCRAGGSAVALNQRKGSQVSVINSTIAGQGDCLLGTECDSGDCDGSETFTVQNNVFMGYPEFLDPSDRACYIWFEPAVFGTVNTNYNVIFGAKIGNVGLSTNDLVQDPLVVNSNLDTFDGHLQAGSPAIDSGLPVGSLNGLIPANDLDGALRPVGSGVDRGAYEYGSTPLQSEKIGVFRNGGWYLDANGNGMWDGCVTDRCYTFGLATDTPVAGDWNGSGRKKVGVKRGNAWYLDYNGNGIWDGCSVDRCYTFGLATDIPVIGDWNHSGTDKIGVFRSGNWYLDYNGNGAWNGCGTDICIAFGLATDIPVAGDWNGDGFTEIGVFRNGIWYLDYDGSDSWSGCGVDRCYTFGLSTDRPVVGDWSGSGTSKIGVKRGNAWYLDYNGNGSWSGCSTDRCYTFGLASDKPVTGNW